jgi:hypothetical protein
MPWHDAVDEEQARPPVRDTLWNGSWVAAPIVDAGVTAPFGGTGRTWGISSLRHTHWRSPP